MVTAFMFTAQASAGGDEGTKFAVTSSESLEP